MVRNWDALSSSYRERLSRNGVTRSSYESGASLARARGHESTPEHPQQGKGKSQYREYFERRQALENKVNRMKQEAYGNSPRWDAQSSEKHVSKGSIRDLERVASYDSIDDYAEDLDLEPEDYDDPLRYH